MDIEWNCKRGEPLLVNGVEATPAIMSALGRLRVAQEAAQATELAVASAVQRCEFELDNLLRKAKGLGPAPPYWPML